ncbi:ABC transporter permease [Deltaproteobacteria bacterium PRO3]|nr:ABC transporter permease [Deltaproteobacteria bacterium PRO3]
MRKFTMLLMIAWRNIFRNKRRALLTLSILVLGCSGLVVVGGFFQNMIEGFGEVFIHSQTGHIQINAKGYHLHGTRAPLDFLIEDDKPIREILSANPRVSYAVPRLKLQGMASTGETGIAVLALGVDPILEKRMGQFQTSHRNVASTNIVEGSDLDASDPYGVVVGRGLLQSLGLKVGDALNFLTARKAGALDGAELRVRGVFETFIKDFDDRSMKMNLKTAQDILGLPNQIHSLLVILEDTADTETAKAELEGALKGRGVAAELYTWVEQGQYYRQSKDLLRQIYMTIQLIMCTIFFFSVANTTNMILSERMREFGTMMAMGNSRGVIFGMIFLETSILGLLGSCLGLLFATGVGYLLSAVGIPMQPPQASGVYICTISLSPEIYLQTFAISMGSTLLSSLIPGYRAAHFKIIHALGYV